MNKMILDKTLSVLESIEDYNKVLEILSLGLEIKEEHFAVSVMNFQKKILKAMESELEDLVLQIEIMEEQRIMESNI